MSSTPDEPRVLTNLIGVETGEAPARRPVAVDPDALVEHEEIVPAAKQWPPVTETK